MSHQVRMSELSNMDPGQRTRALESLVRATRSGRVNSSALDARIRKLEQRYEISSADLRKQLREGRMKETAEIAEWLFLLDARPDCVSR